MSENKKFNDDIIFQSFSKDYIFESNKEQNKISKNELNEFTFKKNLFLSKFEESTNSNNKTQNIISNEHNSNIYSKNDNNIQESGHFGKYNSKKYKNIIEKNSVQIQPLFYIEEKFNRFKIEEKYNRMNEEEDEHNNSKNNITLPNNISNSSLLNNKLKKIQIIRKKKSINNNSTHQIIIDKIKNNSTFSYKNKNQNSNDKSYLYKKKVKYNNLNLNDISNTRDNSYERCKINNSFYRLNQTFNININEIPKLNKYEICNLYRNNNQNYKFQNSKTNNIKSKLSKIKDIIANNSKNDLKNIKDNKENLFNYSNILIHNQNANNIIINNRNYCPNLGNIKFINYEPEKSYRDMYKLNKSSNRININDNLKNELKFKNIRKNKNLIPSTNSFGIFGKNKNLKREKECKIKNNICSNYTKLNIINNKSIGLYKTRTHKSKLENNYEKNMQNKKIPDKTRFLKERILNYYF